ncbi:MAG: PH domain-containing protein [Methylacidiphilales bacterium]|nr:PH domain-containing protein [Candidatus Methylacidiphilales bacterium]
MKTYKAPWSTLLIVMSTLATLLILGLVVWLAFLPLPKHGSEIVLWLRWLPLLLVPICALSIVRGYAITADAILVHRLFWSTRLPRAGLKSATFEPGIMCKSIRTCGNGGFFSFTGFYWNKTLKSYRAFVTDHRRTVVLHYERRTIVVSPGEPEEFVRALMG